jgi:hypothetical protein
LIDIECDEDEELAIKAALLTYNTHVLVIANILFVFHHIIEYVKGEELYGFSETTLAIIAQFVVYLFTENIWGYINGVLSITTLI